VAKTTVAIIRMGKSSGDGAKRCKTIQRQSLYHFDIESASTSVSA